MRSPALRRAPANSYTSATSKGICFCFIQALPTVGELSYVQIGRIGQLDVCVFLDVAGVVVSVVDAGTGGEVDGVAHNTRRPNLLPELREGAVAGLVGADCCDQGFAIERRYIDSSGHQRGALNDDASEVGLVAGRRAGQRPLVVLHAGAS